MRAITFCRCYFTDIFLHNLTCYIQRYISIHPLKCPQTVMMFQQGVSYTNKSIILAERTKSISIKMIFLYSSVLCYQSCLVLIDNSLQDLQEKTMEDVEIVCCAEAE